ncbi:hypothetical protein CY34DRAFT_353728 [Suillus luteus UH-Slu-Lm8-n1]|uniref:Uncharacterized protein n=1 Tax=Suillus luteus UH-Slu-Lm8-n1 TaxID=930992 RepID=A0A0D0BUX1_9AGAM|nr:hypothetical protein CY34DRAFT_353728 [Suillus luteus UH-Slu-Lm8-n1]
MFNPPSCQSLGHKMHVSCNSVRLGKNQWKRSVIDAVALDKHYIRLISAMTGSHVSFAAHCRHYPRSNSKTETLFPSVETSAENMFKLCPNASDCGPGCRHLRVLTHTT